MNEVLAMCKRAKDTSKSLLLASSHVRREVLEVLADLLLERQDDILVANEVDQKSASAEGLSPAMIDRLQLSSARIAAMSSGVREVALLPDPLEEKFDEQILPNGLRVYKQRVPLGVVGVIYESRPNVTIDVSALCIRSGNAVILRGGKETLATNSILVECVCAALATVGLPQDLVQFMDDPDRNLVDQLLKMYEYVDMLIPRGGAALHRYCRENSLIPVITGGIGICHLFVDESADMKKALDVISNAKVQRPTVCNALDTVLVHKNIASIFLPCLLECMCQEKVVVHLPQAWMAHFGLASCDAIRPVEPDDFDREWLSLDVGVQVVENVEEAIAFITEHSTAHSDGILTQDEQNKQRFLKEVDSSVVYVNASTRFTDGAELGLGAEVAISTQRLHARGPMALQALTTYKWVVQGEYHVRA
ncbi:MAG TPA: glutamate-5-semialdehyde dehydrogenase [Anaerolineaceae bacterium]|nr:glutamate-5-semialdehyde dehydrogenase [Anaerolineaceae bacterium]